jgi:rubrerythrin
MASEHTVADDIVFDLVSIQYHALKAAEAYDTYLGDAHASDHPDVTKFIEQCKAQDQERAVRAHELLRQVTNGGIG